MIGSFGSARLSIPDTTGTLKQELTQMFLLSASCIKAQLAPSILSVYCPTSGHFCPCSPDVRISLKYLGQSTCSCFKWIPLQQLEALWQSLSGVYKMVMRTLLPADNEAHTGRRQQIREGCVFHSLENTAQQKRQSSWQTGTSTLAEKKEIRTELFFLLTIPGPSMAKSVEFTSHSFTVNY